MRQLASIRTVRDIQPIAGADVIVAIQVDGWKCIAKKGEFNVGDMGVYFEIDSFLPGSDERFAFLAKQFINFEGTIGARIRTIKLKGQLAQGLMLPLHLFPEIVNHQVGQDVTEILNVQKWEPYVPPQLAGEVNGNFPSVIKKTDENRIQSLIDEISTEIAGKTFEKTVKLDGTSMTVFRNNDNAGVCGRNWDLRENETNSLWVVARRNKLIEALNVLGLNIALQGELIGEGIQGNNDNIKGQDFFLFNIWDIDTGNYVSPEKRQVIVNQLVECGAKINQVPSLGFITFSESVTVEEILARADGPSLFASNREGLVFKRADGNFSFKAISNWYLQKYADR